VKACNTCGQENPDAARFCLACGSPLLAPQPVIEERKVITVLFTDIVGSTARAEQMDPEDVRARLAPYYVRLRAELERFGGTVEKFIGDAVVALFGAPAAHEDDPERAVRAALAIREAIDELNAEDEWLDLKVRIGVNTGEALVVVGARVSEGEGLAAGDVMNTAARLQSAAPVNGILVGALTQEATRDAIEYRGAEPIAAKGKSEPVPAWEAVALIDAAARPARTGALVGREAEVERLTGIWWLVLRDRRPALATVIGPPGIGKSRLLVELSLSVAATGTVHRGRCLSYGEGITYWPVTELVKSAAGILQSDARETISRKLDDFLDSLDTDDLDELRTIAAALSNLIGIPTTPRGTYAAGDISRAELHWGIKRTFQLLARARPLVLVLEDLHWAEPTLLELIAYLLADETEAPILLVGSARPELAEAEPAFAGDHGRRHTLELDTLTGAEGAALLGQLLGDETLAETAFARKLIENAGGNPLFLEETVRMLRDRDLVDRDLWATDEADLPVPTSVQGLISSRLDRLEPSQKRVAHHAAVVGAVFWAGAVGHLGSTDGGAAEDPEEKLDVLVRKDFVRPNEPSTVSGEDEYAFTHILVRDVAYGQIPKGRRAQLHVRFSDWVTILPGSADEFVEIVAWHLEQACRLSREVARSPVEPPLLLAAGALATAAERAERREGYGEATRYYTRALDVLGEEHPETGAELRLRRAVMRAELGELRDAGDELAAVIDSAGGLERHDLRAEGLVALADVDLRQGRVADAERRLTEAAALAAEIDDRVLQVKTAFIQSAHRGDFLGQFEAAVDQLRVAIATARALGDLPLEVEAHLRLGFMLYNMGDLAGAEVELERTIELAGALGSHRDEARATFQLALVRYYRGETKEAENLALRAREWLGRTGDSYLQVQNLVRGLAVFALEAGRPDLAEEYLREALPIALDIGGWLVTDTYRYLTEALVRQGRLEDARELVVFAARSVPEEDAYARAAFLLAESIVATEDGETVASATSFAEALRLLEELHMPLEVGEVRLSLARSLRVLGDSTGARTEYERSRRIFTRTGAAGMRDKIDDELAVLTREDEAADGRARRSAT
jgi:class 3 adenylate cyclase/tetratricopeptide (TPR) repeat protein